MRDAAPFKYDRRTGFFPICLAASWGVLTGVFIGWQVAGRVHPGVLMLPAFGAVCVILLIVLAFDKYITERSRRQIAAASNENERLLRQLTENIREVLWLRSSRGVHYMSSSYEKVMGVPLSEYYKNPRDWLRVVHPADRPHVEKSLDESIARGGGYVEEFRILRPPDGELRWIHIRAFPVEPEEGETFRVAGLTEDVTQRRQLEEQLRQSQKMEAVGQLAGGVAHDFNNILQVILGYGEFLRESLENHGESGETLVSLDNVMDAGTRAMVLIRQLLNFSRNAEFSPVSVDLNAVVSDLLRMLERLLGPGIQVVLATAPRLPMVLADPGQVEQILINLCVNARDAMPDGGTIRISLNRHAPNGDAESSHPDTDATDVVEMRVSDSGTGIPREQLDRIFEPFFTTKEVGKGTGLGLATVYAIVNRHQGFIDVESEENVGTTFRILLPVSREGGMVRERRTADPSIDVMGSHETLLVAEDDDLVRRFLCETLRRWNYRILPARDGQEALELFRQHGNDVQLVLCDLIMPRLGGPAVYRWIRDRRPEIPFIFFSGCDESPVAELDIASGGLILRKPVPARELLLRVRQILDSSPADEKLCASTE